MEPPHVLAETVARLRESAEPFEGAHRGVVDRAVGLLAGRADCRITEAEAALVRLARDEGRDVADVAAVVLRLLDQPEGDRGDGDPHPLLDVVRYRLNAPDDPAGSRPFPPATLDWLLTRHADELAERLCGELARAVDSAAVIIAAVGPDGSLEIGGSAGVGTTRLLRGQRLPVNTSAPAAAVRSGRPLWLADRDDAARRFELIDPDGRWGSRAWLPVRHQGRVLGVVGVLWNTHHPLDEATRRAVRATISSFGPQLRQLLTAGPAPAPTRWLAGMQAVLDVVPYPAVLLAPVRDRTGRVEDFRCVAATPEAVDRGGRRGHALLGATVQDWTGDVPGSELWSALRTTLATGEPHTVGLELHHGSDDPDLPPQTVRTARFGDAVLVSWSSPDDARHGDRLRQIERIANIGWWEWTIASGVTVWSPQMYRIFGRDPDDGPLTIHAIARMIGEDDAPGWALAVADLLEHGTPLDVSHQLKVGGVTRQVRAIGRAVLDSTGRPIMASGVVQDITEPERRRELFAGFEKQLAEQRLAELAEHQVTVRLQEAVLPYAGSALDLSGLRVETHYRAATQLSHGGGDWYYAAALPGGGGLFAVGDVNGHGVLAAATMSHLRHSLAALSVATADPAQLLAALNRLLFDGDRDVVASAVIARYDPAGATLTWAQAGHPAPMIARRGQARQLARPPGMLLGSDRDGRYTTRTVPFAPGDLLMLYTDGLVTVPGRPWRSGVLRAGRALRVAAAEPGETLPVLLRELPPPNPHDDACVLLVRADPQPAAGQSGSQSPPVGSAVKVDREFDRDTLEAARLEVLACATANGIDDVARYMFVLATMEMATNAVRHGGSSGHLRIWRHGPHLYVEVTDRGEGIPAARQRPRQPRPGQIGGWGMWLAHEICEDVQIESGAGGTRVLLRYRIAPAVG